MSEAIHYERVKEHLESLKLLAALNELDSLLEAGSREERSVSWFLDELSSDVQVYALRRRPVLRTDFL